MRYAPAREDGPKPYDEVDARLRTCSQCGHLCDRLGEYHPYIFCVLKKAGRRDPWEDLRGMADQLGIGPLPEKPPLVRDLPLRAPDDMAVHPTTRRSRCA